MWKYTFKVPNTWPTRGMNIHSLTQPETPQACCKLWILPACWKLSTSCSKSVDFNKFHQVYENQTCCNLIFADLPQVVKTTCIKFVDKQSWQSTCIKPVDNLQQTCYRQAEASDANASWYRLDDCKVTSLQQHCCNLRVCGCVLLFYYRLACDVDLNPRLNRFRGLRRRLLSSCNSMVCFVFECL